MGFWIGLFSDNPTWRATMDYMPWICQPWIAVQNAKWLFTVFSTCIWFVWELSAPHPFIHIYHHFPQETFIHGTWPIPGAHTEDVPDRHFQMVLTHHPDAGPRVESVLKAPDELWEAFGLGSCITVRFLPCTIGDNCRINWLIMWYCILSPSW